MQLKRRLALSIAMVVLIAGIAACGSPPAEEAPPNEPAETAEPEAPAPEPVEPEPMPEPEEQEPEAPQLEGNIIITDDTFEWTDSTAETADYYWTLAVQNDTTQTLDITLKFQFLDGQDAVVKEETSTVRLAPAERQVIREEGTMSFDEANRVVGYLADYEWEIVEG